MTRAATSLTCTFAPDRRRDYNDTTPPRRPFGATDDTGEVIDAVRWVRLDCTYPQHPKVRDLSPGAFHAHVSAICYAGLYDTDGDVLRSVIGDALRELVEAGLVEDDGDVRVVRLHDFALYQPNESRREAGRARARNADRDDGGRFTQNRTSHQVSPANDQHALLRNVTSGVDVDVDFEVQRQGVQTFDTFWATYPRRTGKGAARVAFTKAIAKVGVDAVIAGAARLRDDPNRDPEYTPHPATWLNQERWDDDPLPRRTPARGKNDDTMAQLNRIITKETP